MNIELLKEKINTSEIVFTDIFDTLIYRKNYPDYNKQLWCEAVKDYYKLKYNVKKIIDIREKTEIYLRKQNKKRGKEFEFNYNELVKILYKKLNINDSLSNFMKTAIEIEIDIEFNSQEVLDDALEIMRYCESNNKKIVCISDMYLTKEMLEKIMQKHNIKRYIYDIIVSSEILKNKSSGTLYDYVKEKYRKYDIKNCIMMGDNYWYDCRNSIDKGFSGIFIDRGKLFKKYEETKKHINESKYIKKLNLIKDFYPEYDYEFNAFNILKKINTLLYKNNIEEVYYTDKTSDIIQRLKLFNGEAYFTKHINFILSTNDSLVKSCGDKYNINVLDETIEIDKNEGNINCFIDILKNLINKVYNKNQITYEVLEQKIIEKNIPKEKLKEIGKNYTPIFEDFAKWINSSLIENKIDKIYFFTREGEFFKKVFDQVKNKNIETDILEVSRIATFFPSFTEISIDEMMNLWNQYSIQSLSSMFKSLNVDIRKYLDYIYKYQLNICDEIIYPFNNVKVKRLFQDKEFITQMTEDLKDAKEKIIGYCKEHGLTNEKEKIAIVDIGWRGTIQDNICKIFTNKTIYGYYFGLQEFLNKQPKNALKQGYINQYYGYYKILGDITPFEMLCNSCNGSTIGYKKENNKYLAIRKIDEIENESYYNCTKYIQEGVIKNIGKIKYDENAPFESLTNIIYNPDKYVTRVYFNLKHNEEFGLGEFVSKKAKINKKEIIKGTLGHIAAENINHKLEKTTWPHGYLINNNLESYITKLPLHHINDFDKIRVTKKIAWIMPDLLEGSGGHRTIIENANYLVKKGYQCDLYFNEDCVTTSIEMINKIKKLFGECLCQVYIGMRLRTKYDMIFATYSVLTPEIVKNSDCKNKMYFIQDFEPWFDSMGDGYISKENTYKYGFRSITIGNWLSYKLCNEYSAKVSSFPFCANLKVYHPIKAKKENAICFIFQPDKPRRCVELGLKALKLVKAAKPNIKIYLYGSKQEYYVDFEHENLKIISIEKCNELYNKCKVGLCISSSNPSRIPFEMMASGLPVVDVYRENNLYDMPSDGVSLAYSTPESIATEIIRLLDNPKLAQEKSDFGINYMKNYDLKEGFEMFYQTVKNILEGQDKINNNIKQIYTKKPSEINNEVKMFEDILRYRPQYHETSDYLRGLVKQKRRVIKKLNKLKITKKMITIIFDIVSRNVNR